MTDQPAASVASRRRGPIRRLLRWIRHLLISLILLALLLLTAVGALLFTDEGVSWLIAEAQQRSEGRLTIEEVRGNLWRHLELSGVALNLPEVELRLGELVFRWFPDQLLDGQVRVAELRTDRLRIRQLASDHANQPTSDGFVPPESIDFPLDVTVDELRVTDIRFEPADGAPVVVDDIHLSIQLADQQLQVSQLGVRAPDYAVTGALKTQLRTPYASEVWLDWSAAVPGVAGLEQLAGRAELAGDLRRMGIQHRLRQPWDLSLKGDARDLLGQRAWDLTAEFAAIDLPLGQPNPSAPHSGKNPDSAPSTEDASINSLQLRDGRIHTAGKLDDFTLELELASAGAGAPPVHWQGQLQGNAEKLQVDSLVARVFDGEIVLGGEVEPATRTARLQLALRELLLPTEYLPSARPEGTRLNGEAAIALADDRLDISEFELKLEETQIQLAGDVQSLGSGKPELALTLGWDGLRWPLNGEIEQFRSERGELVLKGFPDAYALVLHMDMRLPELPTADWSLRGEGDLTHFSLQALDGQVLAGDLAATGEIDWQGDPQVDLQLALKGLDPSLASAQWPKQFPLDGGLLLKLEQGKFEVSELALDLGPQTDGSSGQGGTGTRIFGAISGQLPQDNRALSVDSRLEWRELGWPLDTGRLAYLEQGSIRVEGSPDAWRMQLFTRLEGEQIPSGSWQVAASGDGQDMRIEQLQGKLLDGELRAEGQLAWLPAPSWSLQLDGVDLNPGLHWPEWPGELGFSARSAGRVGESLEADFELARAEGRLRDYPVAASAKGRLAGENLELSALQLQSGSNTIIAQGGLIEGRLAADWSLQLDNLYQLTPRMRGNLSGTGALAGTLEQPEVRASLEGSRLQVENHQLEQLRLELQASTGPGQPLQLDLSAGPLSQDGVVLAESFALRGEGRSEQHQITLDTLLAGDQRVQLELDGGLDAAIRQWQGKLARLQLALGPLGDWRTPEAARLGLAAEQVSLQGLCLEGKSLSRTDSVGRLCTDLEWSPQAGSGVAGRIESLDLGQFLPNLRAVLEGTFDASLAAEGRLGARANFTLSPGSLLVPADAEGEAMRELPLQGGDVRVKLDADGLLATLDLGLLEQSRASGEVRLPGFNRLPMAPEQPLAGELRVDLTDLDPIAALVPALEDPRGSLRASLTLDGTLEQPLVRGEVKAEQVAMGVPAAGLELKNISLNAHSTELLGEWELTSRVESGDGWLELSGNLETTGERADLTLEGDDFLAFKTADAEVHITPSLHLERNEAGLIARGVLSVPQAAITPQISFPNPFRTPAQIEQTQSEDAPRPVQLPSSDVVVVDTEGQPIASESLQPLEIKAPLAIDSDLRLALGRDVRVDAAGFRSLLTGQIRMRNQPDDDNLIPITSGEIKLVDGTFQQFGQDLEIEDGRILFTNVRATEPDLFIRAVRRINDDDLVTVAGVLVTGTPSKLELEIFSEPDLEQSVALTYLLTGAGPNNVQRVLGVGTYLRPDLYVGYGMDLLDKTGSFNLRYQIKRNFGVEAEVGESDNAVTFSYVLER